MRKILFTILLLSAAFTYAQEKVIDVILYGGQSNATGQGYMKNIPGNFKIDTTVWIYYSKWLKGGGEPDKWIPLCQASGKPDKFGAELTLGTRLHHAYPDRQFAIIKHALSGSNLYNQWNPGENEKDSVNYGPEYRKFINTVDAGLEKLRSQGYHPLIRAMVWQQGEGDARDRAGMDNSRAYGQNLSHFIKRVRQQFGFPGMLFVYGYVIPVPLERFTGREEVRTAQRNVDQNSGNSLSTSRAVVVETDDLPLRSDEPDSPLPNDKVHYNTYGMLELGIRYARAIEENWQDHVQYNFHFNGKPAHIVFPNAPLNGNPWIWRARFSGWHTEMDSMLLNEGYHVAFLNTNNQYGSPKAMDAWDDYYEYLTTEYHFSKKVCLEGVSRGGLFIYNWAKSNPEKINCIYAEAPVCDIKSWPGGFGKGKGSDADWERLKKEYGFSSDKEAKAYDDNPFDNLEKLAQAKVPLIHMIGLNDRVVPAEENTFMLIKRYVKLGGPAMIVPCTEGEQDLWGHHYPIDDPKMAADFIKYHTELPSQLLDPVDYHNHRGNLRNSLIKFEREKKGRVAFLGGSITYNGGWRDSICSYLQKRFPDTEFEFIVAGIPSMGTTPGAFRLERDVLSKGKVDLLFEEAAVNDASNGRTDKEQVRAMEGIVRHARNDNPAMDIVIMHFVDPDKMEKYRSGEIPVVIQNHEKVAVHYNIPTINLAKEVTERIDAGEFTWEDDFKNLHPSPFGQNVYARSMKAFLDKAWAGFVAEDDKITSHIMPESLDAQNYDNGVLVNADKAELKKGWSLVKNWKPADKKGTRPNYVNVPMLVADQPGSTLEFSFEAATVGIAVAAGHDAGIVEYSIDGGKWKQQDLFTRWSASLHLPWYYTLATGLSGGKHTLKLRIANEKNSQSKGNACRIRYFFVNR